MTLAYPLLLSGKKGGFWCFLCHSSNEAAVISSHHFGIAPCHLSLFMIRVFQVIKSDDDACRVSMTMSTYFFLEPFAKNFLGHVGTSKGNPQMYPKTFLTRKSKVGEWSNYAAVTHHAIMSERLFSRRSYIKY